MRSKLTYNGEEISIEQAFDKALQLLSQNHFAEMTELCRIIAEIDPMHYKAVHGIGLGLHRSGYSTEGIKYIRKSIEINPEYFSAYNNLGKILCEQNNFAEALEVFTVAKKLEPSSPLIYANLGGVLKNLGRYTEALLYFNKALELDPDYIDALFGHAISLHRSNKTTEAQKAYMTLLQRKPDHPDALYNLATLYKKAERPKDAYALFIQTLEYQPDHYDALLSLGNLLSEQVQSGNNCARDEALDFYCKASDLRPEDVKIHITIGNILIERGDIDNALFRFRKALELDPANLNARSCILMTTQYLPSPDLHQLYSESILWSKFSKKDVEATPNHKNIPDPERKIRIGYVSADLRIHPVGFYLLPSLYHHSSYSYENYCYYNSDVHDFLTEKLKCYSDGWRDVKDLSDKDLHDLIISDGIDILVDLSGHTRGHRLQLFVSRPAPIQITWIGFFFTTGLTEIDYILMDETAVRPEEEEFFSEEIIRLPETRFCYAPPVYAPEIALLPLNTNGYVTFGSFNNLAKITSEVISLWSKLLKEVPRAKLLLKSGSLGSIAVQKEIASKFELCGIDTARLIFRAASPHADMLAEYGEMDLALDPFPFNGGVTSCEALWMGVPIITLFGNRPISRQTAGFLKTIGLEGFIAYSETDYIELAKKWSLATKELAGIRSSLRNMMSSSLLCDGKRFTVNLEKTYRETWKKWCSSMS